MNNNELEEARDALASKGADVQAEEGPPKERAWELFTG